MRVSMDFHSLNGNELDIEDQRRVGGDHATDCSRPVRVVGGACKVCTLANTELGDALVPSLDHL